MKRIYFILILLSSFQVLQAQFVATTTANAAVTPQTLVQNDLLGAGIAVFNITTNIPGGADPRQFARFNNANSALPFNSGVMLSSGLADNYNNTGNNSTMFGNDLFGAGDADLNLITAPSATFDAAVLEFDFIPLSDTVRFRYVFASEEYPEYACANVNDAFGFFISGPGIAGAQNIAIIPGSNPALPVAINTVNSGIPGISASIPHTCVAPNGSLAFSNLYVDNTVSATFQFDGLTTVLEAVAVVVPCSTYHIKLAIADAFDGIYDSAVFFEANSFSSDFLDIAVDRNRPDSIIVEGCADNPLVTLTLPTGPVSSTYPIPLNIFGSAINGVDYANLPDTVFINTGDSSVSFLLNVFDDGLSEGTETIFIEIRKSVCQFDTLEFVIVDGAAVTANATVTSNYNGSAISCADSCNAVTTAIGIGGITLLTGDFTYQWDASAANQTSAAASGLCAGVYEVIIFDDNLCSDTVSVTVTEPSAVTASITSVVDATCATLGTATGAGTGGTGAFGFLWPASASNQSTATASGLNGGAYQVTVSDANGCSDTISAFINSVATASVVLDSVLTVSCNGLSDGAIYTTTSGVGFTYTWSNGATTEDITGLSPNVYTATATDGNSCVVLLNATVTEPSAITASIAGFNNVSCNGLNDGDATVAALGGTGTTYSYTWPAAANNQTGLVATGLAAGVYTVIVSDSNNCTATSSVTISAPSAITASITTTAISCYGGDDGVATITAAGGSPGAPNPYTYDWGLGFVASNSSPGSPFGTAGVQTVIVSDANNCTISETYTLTEPSAISFTVASTDASCNGYNDGTASINASGGVGGFSYAWSTSAQTTATATGLTAGIHCVTATDGNGCTVDTCITVSEPSGFSIPSFSSTDASCFGGSDGQLSVSISGGISPYTYLWSAGGQTTATATGLTAIVHTVTISDANGCTITGNAPVAEPSAILVSLDVDSVQCKNGSDGQITATVSGGTFPYTYLWDANASNQNTAIATGLTSRELYPNCYRF